MRVVDISRRGLSPEISHGFGVPHAGAPSYITGAQPDGDTFITMADDLAGNNRIFPHDIQSGFTHNAAGHSRHQHQDFPTSHQCHGNCVNLQLPLSPQTMINEDGSDASQSILEMVPMLSQDIGAEFDPNSATEVLQPIDFGWRGDQLPIVIQNLLSGMSTY